MGNEAHLNPIKDISSAANESLVPSTSLPRFGLPRLRLLHAHDLIAIQQTQGVKRLLQLPHRIDRRLPQLMREVVALDEADAVLACDCAFHFDGALDHAVDDGFGGGALAVVEEDNC